MSARDQAADLRINFEDLLQDQPLVVGALGVALAAALGAMLPGTRQEDRLMGNTSDKVFDRGIEKATAKYDQARRKVKEKAKDVEAAVKNKSPPCED
jgi:hypothetical protein